MTEGKKMQFAQYEEKVHGLPSVALRFIIKDAKEALQAMPDTPNAGYYQDEILICSQELTRRMKNKADRECNYHETLTQVYMILRVAGYCTNDLIDDLRDLVNDAYRPAAEEDER